MPGRLQAEGAVQRALESQLFGKFTTVRRLISVAQTPEVIFKNNPERIGWVMVNTGNIQITFDIIQDVTAGKGLILPAEGDTVSVNYIEDAQYPTHEISAIASAAGGEVYITEFIRVSL